MSEVIERYELWLKRGYTETPYFKNENEWRKELNDKINQLKNIK